jgi:hypothetical protein
MLTCHWLLVVPYTAVSSIYVKYFAKVISAENQLVERGKLGNLGSGFNKKAG